MLSRPFWALVFFYLFFCRSSGSLPFHTRFGKKPLISSVGQSLVIEEPKVKFLSLLHKLATFVIGLFRVTLHNPLDLFHVLGIARFAVLQIATPELDVRTFTSIDILDLAPGSIRWKLQAFPGIPASISVLECNGLALLAKKQRLVRFLSSAPIWESRLPILP